MTDAKPAAETCLIDMVAGEFATFGAVKVQRLPDGYYWFEWSKPGFDCTERVHPWNVTARARQINVGLAPTLDPDLPTDDDRRARIDAWRARKAARVERLRERAERATAEASARFGSRNIDTLRGMAGEPIKVGHHSERRHRKLIERADNDMRKGCEAMDLARDLGRRADVAERSDAVDSRDPEAPDLLRAKLVDREAEHARMKAINAAHKRYLADPASLEADGIAVPIAQAVRDYAPVVPWQSRPFPAYCLSNSNKEISRLRDRIAALEARAATPDRPSVTVGDVVISEDPGRDAVLVVYPGKPDEATRARLKADGFRWAPSVGAWTRRRSPRTYDLLGRIFPGYADLLATAK